MSTSPVNLIAEEKRIVRLMIDLYCCHPTSVSV